MIRYRKESIEYNDLPMAIRKRIVAYNEDTGIVDIDDTITKDNVTNENLPSVTQSDLQKLDKFLTRKGFIKQ